MKKKITIIDYGIGNILSIKNVISFLGENAIYSSNHEDILNSTHVILPGVGSFPAAMNKLRELNLIECLKKLSNTSTKILGICLGMQLLFDRSFEFRECDGIGLLKGEIKILSEFTNNKDLKLPHIGWNNLIINELTQNLILKNISSIDSFYFVHSYGLQNFREDYFICNSKHSETIFPSIVNYKNVYGCQFHPERSSKSGIKIFQNFLNLSDEK